MSGRVIKGCYGVSCSSLTYTSCSPRCDSKRLDLYNLYKENGSGATGSKFHLPSFGFGQKHDATVNVPFDIMNDPSNRERELNGWEEDFKRKELDIKRREGAVSRAGVPTDDKNWPPFFPIINHDIAGEIPIHAQKLQYLAFASWLGILMLNGTEQSFHSRNLWSMFMLNNVHF